MNLVARAIRIPCIPQGGRGFRFFAGVVIDVLGAGLILAQLAGFVGALV